MAAPSMEINGENGKMQSESDRIKETILNNKGKILLVVGILGMAAVALSQPQTSTSTNMTQLFTATNAGASAPALSFQVGNSATSIKQNDAERAKNIPVGYPWKTMIEPHRETTFEARENFCDECDDDAFVWTIDGNTLTGRVVQFTSTRVGSHSVLLSVTDLSGVIIQHEDTVMSKYKRREIRSLSESDRELIIDTIHSIYTHSTQAGHQKGFGDRFQDIAHFVSKHLDGSASKECDKWHDGASFYTSHVAFSLEFEQAMQAVNPIASLPYWDFTKDQYMQSVEGINWKSSHIFGEKWFGSVTTSSADHAIDSGKFAYTPIKKVGYTDDYIHNPYGFLRSPWNVNNSPYVTRSAKVDGYNAFSGELPSCKAYMDCFMSSSIAVMTECLNGKAHGSVHVEIGGVWNKDISNSLIEETSAYPLLLMTKNLWRQGWVMCPAKCSADEVCECKFNDEARGSLTAYEVLRRTGMFEWIYTYSEKVYLDVNGVYRIKGLEGSKQETAAWEVMLRDTLSKTGFVGDMYSSASPYDPTFWLIHGTIDRLMHWRRLIAHSDYVDMPLDATWGYAHDVKAASDSRLVCDWSNVDPAKKTGMPVCTSGECPGTIKDDTTTFSGFTATDVDYYYTNSELFKFLSPLNEELPYVYDNFEWTHCDEQGLRFGVQKDGTVLTSYTYPKKGKKSTQ